jgi:hypothetical protein
MGIHLPASGPVQWLFTIFVTPHLCWILLILAIILLSALHRPRQVFVTP